VVQGKASKLDSVKDAELVHLVVKEVDLIPSRIEGEVGMEKLRAWVGRVRALPKARLVGLERIGAFPPIVVEPHDQVLAGP